MSNTQCTYVLARVPDKSLFLPHQWEGKEGGERLCICPNYHNNCYNKILCDDDDDVDVNGAAVVVIQQ